MGVPAPSPAPSQVGCPHLSPASHPSFKLNLAHTGLQTYAHKTRPDCSGWGPSGRCPFPLPPWHSLPESAGSPGGQARATPQSPGGQAEPRAHPCLPTASGRQPCPANSRQSLQSQHGRWWPALHTSLSRPRAVSGARSPWFTRALRGPRSGTPSPSSPLSPQSSPSQARGPPDWAP